MLIAEGSKHRGRVTDLAFDLAQKSADLRQSLPPLLLLLDKEALVSSHPGAPLRLAFPATLATRWLPGLFLERTPGDQFFSPGGSFA